MSAKRTIRNTGSTLGRALGGIAASLSFFLVLGEIGARSFGIIDRINGTPRALYMRTTLPDLPYRLRPDAGIAGQDKPVTINHAGLRGTPVRERKSRLDRRIFVLGDSVVFGAGVADDQTFPVQLELRLTSHHGWSGQVLNGGIPGYNTAAELAFFAAFGVPLSPDHVLLGVSLNDFGDTPALNAFGVMTNQNQVQAPTWLEEHSELYLLAVWSWKFARGEHWFQMMPQADDKESRDKWAAVNDFVERHHRSFYNSPRGPGWERIRTSLAALRDHTHAAGSSLTVVVFPEKFQFGDDAFRVPQQVWLRLCNELGIDAIDLWPAFDAAIRDGNDALFFDTQHPNAAGLAVAAEAVAAHITGIEQQP